MPGNKATGQRYTICVRGDVDASWLDWAEGAEVVHTGAGDTTISIPTADRAALHGILDRVCDLNLTLLSVSICPEYAQKAA